MATNKYTNLGFLVIQLSKNALVCTMRACETDRATRFDVCYLKSIEPHIAQRPSTIQFKELAGDSYNYEDSGDRVLVSGYIPW